MLGRLIENAAWAEGMSIAVSNPITIAALLETPVAWSAGETKEISGCGVVLNCQLFAAARWTPARLRAPVPTVAV